MGSCYGLGPVSRFVNNLLLAHPPRAGRLVYVLDFRACAAAALSFPSSAC